MTGRVTHGTTTKGTRGAVMLRVYFRIGNSSETADPSLRGSDAPALIPVV
jgi:hypothetical protein